MQITAIILLFFVLSAAAGIFKRGIEECTTGSTFQQNNICYTCQNNQYYQPTGCANEKGICVPNGQQWTIRDSNNRPVFVKTCEIEREIDSGSGIVQTRVKVAVACANSEDGSKKPIGSTWEETTDAGLKLVFRCDQQNLNVQKLREFCRFQGWGNTEWHGQVDAGCYQIHNALIYYCTKDSAVGFKPLADQQELHNQYPSLRNC